MNIKQDMNNKFTEEELRVLKNLEFDLNNEKTWSLKRTKPSQEFIIQTQLGISPKEAKKKAMSFLDTLEKYNHIESLEFLGYV